MWCTILFVELIQNKNLEMFQAVPQNISLENFNDIPLRPSSYSSDITEAFVTVWTKFLNPQKNCSTNSLILQFNKISDFYKM